MHLMDMSKTLYAFYNFEVAEGYISCYGNAYQNYNYYWHTVGTSSLFESFQEGNDGDGPIGDGYSEYNMLIKCVRE